jgi:hypothetical protein
MDAGYDAWDTAIDSYVPVFAAGGEVPASLRRDVAKMTAEGVAFERYQQFGQRSRRGVVHVSLEHVRWRFRHNGPFGGFRFAGTPTHRMIDHQHAACQPADARGTTGGKRSRLASLSGV